MDFAGHLLERIHTLADLQNKVVLEFCNLEISTLANSQVPRIQGSEPNQAGLVLKICCPNRFSADQLVLRLIGVLGIEQRWGGL